MQNRMFSLIGPQAVLRLPVMMEENEHAVDDESGRKPQRRFQYSLESRRHHDRIIPLSISLTEHKFSEHNPTGSIQRPSPPEYSSLCLTWLHRSADQSRQ